MKPTNNKEYEFDEAIKKVDGMDATFIEFPFVVKKEFNKERVKV